MNGMLDSSNYQVSVLIDQLVSNAQVESDAKLISMFNLTPEYHNEIIEGEPQIWWVFRWGGLIGVGKTVALAASDFNSKYYNQGK